MATPQRYRFDPFLLDLRSHRLLREGQPVAVQQKVIDLLAALVSRPGETWSREEVRAAVWGDIFVSDDALFQLVRRARKAIEGGTPRIETVRGRGYRFVGEVVPVLPTPAKVPTYSDTFVARRGELAQLQERFDAGRRLVAVVGQGGAGKSRLSMEHLRHGEWPWREAVDLTAARSPSEVVAMVAARLQVPLRRAEDDGREQVGAALDNLGAGLLLLDNVEQLLPDLAELVDAWRRAAPEVRWLLTSRNRSGLDAAERLELPPLATADGRLLFRARARAAGVVLPAAFDDDIDALVADVEGNPLAIELTAARTTLLSPAAIRERLGQVLATFGGRGRHGSVRATVAWSWRLLDPAHRALLAEVAIFPDGFTVALAERVVRTDGDLLAGLDALEQQSLLEARAAQAAPEAGRLRLPVTVREFAREHAAIVPGLAGRYIEAMRALAEQAAELLLRPDRARWRQLYREEHNLAEALHMEATGPRAAEIAAGLAMLRQLDARHREALELLTPYLDDAALPDAIRDRAIAVYCEADALSSSDPRAEERAREAAERARERGDVRLADLLVVGTGRYQMRRSDYEGAVRTLAVVQERCIERGDAPLATRAALRRAACATFGGEEPVARRLLEDALAGCPPGVDDSSRLDVLDLMAYLAGQRGDVDEALALFAEALDLARVHAHPLRMMTIRQNLAVVYMTAGRFEEAQAIQTEVIERIRAVGVRSMLCRHLCNRAHTRMHTGDLAGAQSDLLEAAAVADFDEGALLVDLNRVTLLCLQGRYEDAANRAERTLASLPDSALVMRADLAIWRAIAEAGRGAPGRSAALLDKAEASPPTAVPVQVLEAATPVRAWLAGDESALARLCDSDAPSVSLAARACARLPR